MRKLTSIITTARVTSAAVVFFLATARVWAADVEVAKGRLAIAGRYAVQSIGVKNSTNSTIKSVWVECGFFGKGVFLTTGKGFAENVQPQQTAYFDISATNSSDADSTECRLVQVSEPTMTQAIPTSEERSTMLRRLQGLAGVRMGDLLSSEFDAAIEGFGHDAAGGIPRSLEPAIEALVKFRQMQRTPGSDRNLTIVAGHGTEMQGIDPKAIIGAVQCLYKSIRLGGAGQERAVYATIRFFESAQRDRVVTSASYQDLQSASPQTAQAFANALLASGPMSATELNNILKEYPAALDNFLSVLVRMKPAVDGAFLSEELSGKP